MVCSQVDLTQILPLETVHDARAWCVDLELVLVFGQICHSHIARHDGPWLLSSQLAHLWLQTVVVEALELRSCPSSCR